MNQATLLLGDCLNRMGEIPDGSVDLIFADLPYGTTACKWDSVIPFVPLWAHYRRLLKPRGAVVLTASQPFTSALVMSNPKWFKYCLVWEKNRITNFFNANHQPGKSHEDIAVFSAAPSSRSPRPPMVFNPQRTDGTPWVKRDRDGNPDAHVFHAAKTARLRESDGGRCPRSVLRFDCEHGLHPTQKPVALGRYLIRTYSNPGEVVLDNVMGSGSFGVAAIEEGRDFIGIERDPVYFGTAQRRIDTALEATPLFA